MIEALGLLLPSCWNFLFFFFPPSSPLSFVFGGVVSLYISGWLGTHIRPEWPGIYSAPPPSVGIKGIFNHTWLMLEAFDWLDLVQVTAAAHVQQQQQCAVSRGEHFQQFPPSSCSYSPSSLSLMCEEVYYQMADLGLP